MTNEMINRIRQSGRVQGIEELREELMHCVLGNDIVISIKDFSQLVETLERERDGE